MNLTDVYDLVSIGENDELTRATHIAVKHRVAEFDPSLTIFSNITRIGNDWCYQHHGVYFNNQEVYHLSGPTKNEARCRKSTKPEFMENALDNALYRVEYHQGMNISDVEEIHSRAVKAFNKTKPERYHLLLNNCESFAHYLMTGNRWSAQAYKVVKKFKKAQSYVELGFLAAIGVTGVAIAAFRKALDSSV